MKDLIVAAKKAGVPVEFNGNSVTITMKGPEISKFHRHFNGRRFSRFPFKRKRK